jgi:hypothetical protein
MIMRLLKRCSQLLALLALLCGCACWTTQDTHNYTIRTIGLQNKAYYAALAEGCDVFLKLKALDPRAIYIAERTNLAAAVLPPIITNLNPDRIVYTYQDVTIELNDGCWIDWSRDQKITNVWKMTVSLYGKKRTVYEEPSTKYCLASFGLYDGNDIVITTNRVAHRTGLEFAWKLAIYSRDDRVRIKGILELPSKGVWSDEMAVVAGVKVLSNQVSPDEKQGTTEYDLTIRKGCAQTEFIQPYRVAKDDPTGIYKLSLFINGQPIEKLRFQVVPEH